jgi:flagellar basal body rod protein FlgC
MTAVSSVQSTAVAGMAAAVSRLNVDAQSIVSSQIQPVTPVVPHKQPPAGLTAFDPSYPQVELSVVDQIQALHQFRANLKVFETADQMTESMLSLKA